MSNRSEFPDKRTGWPYDDEAADQRPAQDHGAECPRRQPGWSICIPWLMSDLVEAGVFEICGVRETGEPAFRIAERFRNDTS